MAWLAQESSPLPDPSHDLGGESANGSCHCNSCSSDDISRCFQQMPFWVGFKVNNRCCWLSCYYFEQGCQGLCAAEKVSLQIPPYQGY